MRDGTNRPGSELPFGGGRHRTNGTNGVHPDGMTSRPIPLNEIDEPIDLVAVQADDELINALRGGMTVSTPGLHGYDADHQVAAILAAWKAEVDAEPIPELVDIDTALATIAAATRSVQRRRPRYLVVLAGAAALIVFAMGGVSVGAQSARPGDALFAVTKVLYAQKAESRQAAEDLQDGLSRLKISLATGNTAAAAQQVAHLNELAGKVRPEDQPPMATKQLGFLEAKLQETPPDTPTNPTAPLLDGTPAPVDPAPASAQTSTPSPTPSSPPSPPVRTKKPPPVSSPVPSSTATPSPTPSPVEPPPPVTTTTPRPAPTPPVPSPAPGRAPDRNSTTTGQGQT